MPKFSPSASPMILSPGREAQVLGITLACTSELCTYGLVSRFSTHALFRSMIHHLLHTQNTQSKIRAAVRAGRAIRICGFSLGGALAAILTIITRERLQESANVRAYSFGAPPCCSVDAPHMDLITSVHLLGDPMVRLSSSAVCLASLEGLSSFVRLSIMPSLIFQRNSPRYSSPARPYCQRD